MNGDILVTTSTLSRGSVTIRRLGLWLLPAPVPVSARMRSSDGEGEDSCQPSSLLLLLLLAAVVAVLLRLPPSNRTRQRSWK